jgi:alpha-galactosidase
MADLEDHAGTGGWNDPDMLVIGLNGMRNHGRWQGCTRAEYRTQMSMWCMLAAPLMAGCDLRTVDDESLSVMSNKEIIAIDQDSLGEQGYRVWRSGAQDVWKKPLSDGRMAVALLNRADCPVDISAGWKELEIETGQAMQIRDLWAHQHLGGFTEAFSCTVEPHGTEVFLLSPS